MQRQQALRSETEGKSTLIGFVGAPWTLAAYSIEGGSSKYALHTKKMMMEEPALFHSLMTKLANSIGDYACYQVPRGISCARCKVGNGMETDPRRPTFRHRRR